VEEQVPVFISPTDMATQLYPQARGFLFVAFYDLQGYGGGIVTHLHMGYFKLFYYLHGQTDENQETPFWIRNNVVQI
jgi:hypothetical protein